MILRYLVTKKEPLTLVGLRLISAISGPVPATPANDTNGLTMPVTDNDDQSRLGPNLLFNRLPLPLWNLLYAV